MEEQIQLKRIADCAIDLFAMTSTISRASKAVTSSIENAAHEVKLTNLFCDMASDRIQINLAAIQSSAKRDAEVVAIADEIFTELKYIPSHPTGVN